MNEGIRSEIFYKSFLQYCCSGSDVDALSLLPDNIPLQLLLLFELMRRIKSCREQDPPIQKVHKSPYQKSLKGALEKEKATNHVLKMSLVRVSIPSILCISNIFRAGRDFVRTSHFRKTQKMTECHESHIKRYRQPFSLFCFLTGYYLSAVQLQNSKRSCCTL